MWLIRVICISLDDVSSFFHGYTRRAGFDKWCWRVEKRLRHRSRADQRHTCGVGCRLNARQREKGSCATNPEHRASAASHRVMMCNSSCSIRSGILSSRHTYFYKHASALTPRQGGRRLPGHQSQVGATTVLLWMMRLQRPWPVTESQRSHHNDASGVDCEGRGAQTQRPRCSLARRREGARFERSLISVLRDMGKMLSCLRAD